MKKTFVKRDSNGNASAKERTVMAIFFCQAVAGGGIFTRIPDIQQSLGLGEATLGLTLMAQPIGGLLSFAFASYAVEKFGTKSICIAAIPLIAFASFGFAVAPVLWLGVAALLIYGVGFSLANVAMNVEADRIEAESGRLIMNKCHGWWSIGFLASAGIGVIARAFQISAPLHLAAVFVLILLATIVIATSMQSSNQRPHSGGTKRKFLTYPSIPTLRIVGFGLVGSLVQGGTHNWSVIYMRDSFSAPDWVDALTIPSFLLALTVGRMLGDRWVDRFGTKKVATTMLLCALAGLLLVIVTTSLHFALIGFALMGIGVSTTFPMMVTAAAQLGDRPSSANVAAVTMTTGIAMLAVPPIMGYVAETFGIRASFLALLPSFILGFAMIRYIIPQNGTKTDSS